MLSLADKPSERRFNLAFICLFICLFLIAPSYYQPNPGGEGLFLPFNNVVWIVTSFIIGLGIFKVLQSERFYLPNMTYAMLFFLATTTILGIVNSAATPIPWLFRSLSIWGGILLFLAVAQFQLKRRSQDGLLYIIMLAAALQAVYGLIHLLVTSPGPSWLPVSPHFPRGIFQQQNLNASFSATGLVIAFYLISLPSYPGRNGLFRIAPFIAAGLTSAIIVSAGSRVGLLGAAIGLGIVLISRYRQLLPASRLYTLLLLILVSTLSGIAASQIETQTGGLNASINKFNSSVHDNGGRNFIYKSSWELIKERPILGYGIGQFQKVWHEKKIDYIQAHPNEPPLVPRLSHPHNELLYWQIEGGIAALLGIIVMAAAFLWGCLKLGWSRGGSYLAIIAPITLHTQVELPFYISQLHWVLFVLLIAFVASHSSRAINVRLSKAANVTLLSVAMGIPVVATVFFSDCLSALNTTTQFMISKEKSFDDLKQPHKNIYFADNTTLLMMRMLLYVGIENDQAPMLREYARLANEKLVYTPRTDVFRGLALAYHHLKEYDASHQVMAKALAIYPNNPDILSARDEIMALDKKANIFNHYWRRVKTP